MKDVARDTPPLYGRDDFLDALVTRAVQGGAITVVHGPSGIGKTAILDTLCDRILVDAHVRVLIHHRLISQNESVDYLVAGLSRQLLDRTDLPSPDLPMLRKSLGSGSLRHGWKLGASMLLDLIRQVTPLAKTTEALLQVLQETIQSASPRAQAERLADKRGEHLFNAFLDLLSALASARMVGCILIDTIDKANQAMRESIEALAANLPPTWSLVLTLNDETEAGIEVLRKMVPSLSYLKASKFPVPGLTLEDASVWYFAERGQHPPFSEAQCAVQAAGGRPLFLRDWVAGLDGGSMQQSVLERLGEYYSQRVTALPEDARSLLVRLALLPEGFDFPLELCAALSHKDSHEAVESTAIRLVKANFLDEVSAGTYRFVHDLTREMARSRPAIVLKEAALDVLSALEALSGLADAPAYLSGASVDYARLLLHKYADQSEEIQQLAAPTGARLLAAGMNETALNAFELALEHTDHQADRLGCLLQIAEIHVERGLYEKALSLLDVEIWNGSSMRPKADLVAGTALLRLNRYSEATTRLRKAHHRFRQSGDRMNSLSARRRLSTVLLDQDQCEESAELAASLVEEARREHLPPLLLAKCLRTLARALARGGQFDEAADAARHAIEIARAHNARRDEGNGRLALAEARRHGGDYEGAINSYASAVTIAKELANRDSLLWSTLGMSDALLLLRDVGGAESELARLTPLLEKGEGVHPLEHCHWNLSLAIVGWIRGRDGSREALSGAVKAYNRFSIGWPAKYVSGLVEDEWPPWPQKL